MALYIARLKPGKLVLFWLLSVHGQLLASAVQVCIVLIVVQGARWRPLLALAV